MPTLQVSNATVRYRHEEGPPARRGLPVVLLHMAGGGGSVWGPVASLLGRHAPVVAPDFPAHGQSGPVDLRTLALPPRRGVHPHLLGLAGWTLALLDALALPRVILAGHSMGGMVALCAALAAPQRVAGLGLVCTSGRMTLPASLRQLVAQDLPALAAGLVGAAWPQGPLANGASIGARAIFPQAPLAVVQEDFDAVDGLDLLDVLGALAGLPTVVVTGEMDVLTPPSHGVALAAALGAPAPLRVPDGGHLLPRQQPAVVAHALASLLVALSG